MNESYFFFFNYSANAIYIFQTLQWPSSKTVKVQAVNRFKVGKRFIYLNVNKYGVRSDCKF